MSNEGENEPNELVSGVVTLMTIVVKGCDYSERNDYSDYSEHSDYSETPLEPIVVSHEARDYSSESECTVVIE